MRKVKICLSKIGETVEANAMSTHNREILLCYIETLTYQLNGYRVPYHQMIGVQLYPF